MNNKSEKIEAIKLFLKYSLLFSINSKSYILNNISKFNDPQLEALAELLIYEHDNRDGLDKITAVSFMNELGRVVNSDK